MKSRFLIISSDSLLVVNQVTDVYQAKEDNMMAYLEEAKKMMENFEGIKVEQVTRTENHRADTLAKLATGNGQNLPKGIQLHLLS